MISLNFKKKFEWIQMSFSYNVKAWLFLVTVVYYFYNRIMNSLKLKKLYIYIYIYRERERERERVSKIRELPNHKNITLKLISRNWKIHTIFYHFLKILFHLEVERLNTKSVWKLLSTNTRTILISEVVATTHEKSHRKKIFFRHLKNEFFWTSLIRKIYIFLRKSLGVNLGQKAWFFAAERLFKTLISNLNKPRCR